MKQEDLKQVSCVLKYSFLNIYSGTVDILVMVALKNRDVHLYKDKYLVNVLKCEVCICECYIRNACGHASNSSFRMLSMQ